MLENLFDPGRLLAPFVLSACDRIGRGVRVTGRPRIANRGTITLGNEVALRSAPLPIAFTVAPGATLSVGDGTTLDPGCSITVQASVRVGARVRVGSLVEISDAVLGGGGFVEIADDVAIGSGARIQAGSRIGARATIAPGAVVAGEVAAGAVIELPVDTTAGRAPHGSTASREPPARPEVRVAVRELKGTLLADFTVDDLQQLLQVPDFDGLSLVAEVAPFGQVIQTLHQLAGGAQALDFAVVWSRPEQISPAFARLVQGGAADVPAVLDDVDAYARAVLAAAGSARFLFVPTFCLPPHQRGLGLIDLRPDGLAGCLARMNLKLVDTLATAPNVFTLDAQRWVARVGEQAMNPKLWNLGKLAFSPQVMADAAADLKAAMRAVVGLSRKLVVLDLDDTLWGGIVGETGWEGLRLGGHDAEGEAFVDFQRALLGLSKRGIALALVSKNEESTALDAIKQHPEMLIRADSIAAFRINWNDKARNILEIVEELNLGISSVVFIDDNPVERGRVRDALPEVFVPDWPVDPTQYTRALEGLRCFDSPRISAEDAERTRMYVTERERASLKTKASSFDDWLRELDLGVVFEPLGQGNVARVTQLLNKTNQMNLRTRRLSEKELMEWARSGTSEVWAVRVSDRFGDAGLTGILSVERRADDVHLADFVLSCRVMGRRVEETLVWAAVSRARSLGGRTLVVEPLPTKKNKPCLDFWEKINFPAHGGHYVQPLEDAYSAPEHVRVEGLS